MTTSTVAAGPWDQLFPRSEGAVLKGADTPRRRVRGGKLQTEAMGRPTRDRAIFSRMFCEQLEQSLVDRARELENLWDAGAVSEKTADLTIQIFQTAYAVVDLTLKHKRAGAPPTLRQSKHLQRELQKFEENVAVTLTGGSPKVLDLARCLQDLSDDITHYVRQIHITFAMVYVTSAGQVKPTNRPTNWAAKTAFDEIIHSHQLKFGARTFPKLRQARLQLQQAKHYISDRMLRYWFAQMRSGTFSDYVQQRKRQ